MGCHCLLQLGASICQSQNKKFCKLSLFSVLLRTKAGETTSQLRNCSGEIRGEVTIYVTLTQGYAAHPFLEGTVNSKGTDILNVFSVFLSTVRYKNLDS